MSIFDKIKNLFTTPEEELVVEKSSVPLQYEILATESSPISSDFTKGYPPAMAEDSKFVVADTTDPAYEGYPEDGFGKYVQLAHIVPSMNSVDFSKGYNPAMAENGKFVELTLDDSVGWPSTNYPKYAVLTYIVNPDALQLQGGTLNGNLNLSGFDIFDVGNLYADTIETSCGNSSQWCSVYTHVRGVSTQWGGGGGGSDVSGLSADWESTYTTVLANSAVNWDNTGLIAETTVNTLTGDLQTQITSNDSDIAGLTTTIQTNSAVNWDNELTLKLDQTTPQTVINGAPIFNGGIESYLKDYSGVLAVDTIGRTLNDDSGVVIATWDDSGVSIVGCLSADCIRPQSTETTPISVHSSFFMVSDGGGIDMQDNPMSNLHYIDWHLDDSIPPSEGRLSWNDDDGTLDLGLKGGNVNLQIGQETVLRVRASEDIADGKVVYIDGASGQNPTAAIASKDDLLSSHSVIGVATETIANSDFGYITTQGLVRGIDTSNINIGNIAYLGTAGALVSSIPITPDHEVRVGVVVNSSAAPNGILYVDVSLGFDINEIHDINITSPQDNDVLLYSSVSSAWLNSDQANNWDSTYTTVCANSATWADHFDSTLIESASSNWDSTYTTVLANSADWSLAQTTSQIVSSYGSIETNENTTFTLANSSGIVLVDASAGNTTVVLPNAVGNDGRRYTTKKIDSTNNTVTLSANTNIDNQPTFIIRQQYDAIEFISNNVQWWII